MDGGGCSQRVPRADARRYARTTFASCMAGAAHGRTPVIGGPDGGWCWCGKVQG